MPILTALAVAVVGFVVLYLLGRFCQRVAADLRGASAAQDEFYKCAQALVCDKATPDRVLDFVEFLAAQSAKPRLARRFLRDIITGRVTRTIEKTPARAEFRAEVESMSAQQRQNFANVVSAVLISSAASDVFLSRVHQRVIGSFLTSTGRRDDPRISLERAETVAEDLTRNFACVA